MPKLTDAAEEVEELPDTRRDPVGSRYRALESILDDAVADLDALPPIPRALLLGELTETLTRLRGKCAGFRAEAVFQVSLEGTAAEVATALGLGRRRVENVANEYRVEHPDAPRKSAGAPRRSGSGPVSRS